jgi:hypothetical protein
LSENGLVKATVIAEDEILLRVSVAALKRAAFFAFTGNSTSGVI